MVLTKKYGSDEEGQGRRVQGPRGQLRDSGPAPRDERGGEEADFQEVGGAFVRENLHLDIKMPNFPSLQSVTTGRSTFHDSKKIFAHENFLSRSNK